MKKIGFIYILLSYAAFAFLYSVCMDLPQHLKSTEDQRYFNHLVRSHAFDKARTYVNGKENLLDVSNSFLCPLSIAINENDYSAVSFLLSLPMKYNDMHYIQVKNKKMAKLLTHRGKTDHNTKDLHIQILFAMTRHGGYKKPFMRYTMNAIDINMRIDDSKNTFLHNAVATKNRKALEVLLENSSINIHKKNIHGLTAYQLAIDCAQPKIIDLFNKVGIFFSPIERGNPCEIEGDEKKIEFLAENEKFLATLLFNTTKREVENLTKQKKAYSAQQGIMCNSKGYYFLNASMKDLECWMGLEKMENIKKHLADICCMVLDGMRDDSNHLFKGTLPRYAFLEGIPFSDHNSITKLVKKYPFTLFYNGTIAFEILFEALNAINAEAFRYIVNFLNPDLSLADENGNTLLHWAIFLKKDFEAKLLIEKGANCFVTNNENETAFDSAKTQSQKSFNNIIIAFSQACLDSPKYAKRNIKKYLQLGYQLRELIYLPKDWIHMCEKKIQPLLHGAAQCNIELCRILLKAGTCANIKNHDGMTPLQCICHNTTRTTAIPLLLEYGAIVTEEMTKIAIDKDEKDRRAMLVRAWKAQQQQNNQSECCICFEVNVEKSIIPCKIIHNDRICKSCYSHIQDCPICRQPLNK